MEKHRRSPTFKVTLWRASRWKLLIFAMWAAFTIPYVLTPGPTASHDPQTLTPAEVATAEHQCWTGASKTPHPYPGGYIATDGRHITNPKKVKRELVKALEGRASEAYSFCPPQ